jgi:hypothetical protein
MKRYGAVTEISKVDQILNLCARVQQHPVQHHSLVKACSVFSKWDILICRAEEQGMGPLLHWHLTTFEESLPDSFLRGLRFLRLRHRQANALLAQSLRYMLELLEAEGMPSLVLKGAALCRTLYPDPGLRPMRDIDLLLAKEDVQRAHVFLQEKGFRASTSAIPEDHFHLPALYHDVDGLQVCIELHHDLLPNCPPYYQPLLFADLYSNALAFDVDGITAYTLATEEMLWHLYQHGFHAPLTYEPYKLISVADIVSLVEKKFAEIDWLKMELEYPQLLRALPLFHHITPWNDEVLEAMPFSSKVIPSKVGERFTGWPYFRLSEQRERGFIEILRYTFFPGQWWMLMYYTPESRLSYIWSRLVRHPMHIFWWIKLYWNIYLKENTPPTGDAPGKKGSMITGVKNAGILIVGMYKKFK